MHAQKFVLINLSIKVKVSHSFLFSLISTKTLDQGIFIRDGNKTWNIESLVTEVCDVQDLVGKPKLFFIEACRGKENNFSTMMSKANNPAAPCGISLPRYDLKSSSKYIFITTFLASKMSLLDLQLSLDLYH